MVKRREARNKGRVNGKAEAKSEVEEGGGKGNLDVMCAGVDNERFISNFAKTKRSIQVQATN